MRSTQLVRQAGSAVRITVRVQPRSSRTTVEGVQGDVIRVRVQAPPVDGAANDAVCALLAETLGIAKGRVRVVSGAGARTKTVEIEGLRAEDIRSRLGASGEER